MRFSRDWDKYAANIYLWLNILQTSTNMEDIHISVQRYGLLASLYCLSLISYLYHNDRYLHAFSFVSSRHHGMFDVEGKFSFPPPPCSWRYDRNLSVGWWKAAFERGVGVCLYFRVIMANRLTGGVLCSRLRRHAIDSFVRYSMLLLLFVSFFISFIRLQTFFMANYMCCR